MGQGYGHACLTEALNVAFFDLRKEKVIAHIYKNNVRSQNLFVSWGFVPCKEGTELTEYQLTYTEYLDVLEEMHTCSRFEDVREIC